MTPVTFLTPLRTEHLAARRGVTSARVVRTGMGPARSLAAARALASGPGELGVAVVLGVAGGLQPGQAAGDVVVASRVAEVRDGAVVDQWVELPGADTVAALLVEKAGLRASVGGVVSSPGVVWGEAARRGLADAGGLAVDMESWWLVDGLASRGVPVAVVRVLLDCPGAGLVSAGSVVRMPRTYRVLSQVAGAVEVGVGRGPEDVLVSLTENQRSE